MTLTNNLTNRQTSISNRCPAAPPYQLTKSNNLRSLTLDVRQVNIQKGHGTTLGNAPSANTSVDVLHYDSYIPRLRSEKCPSTFFTSEIPVVKCQFLNTVTSTCPGARPWNRALSSCLPLTLTGTQSSYPDTRSCERDDMLSIRCTGGRALGNRRSCPPRHVNREMSCPRKFGAGTAFLHSGINFLKNLSKRKTPCLVPVLLRLTSSYEASYELLASYEGQARACETSPSIHHRRLIPVSFEFRLAP